MEKLFVDFNKTNGIVRPHHSVNNAPVYSFAADQRITNIEPWRAAGIPYGRTHDASYCSTYGGEHTVDVNFIFTDFDRDPDDPDAYDFTLTDFYLDLLEAGGTKIFFRLGSKIEHWSKKYNTLPPKDFKKWAVVCEHIIRHFNEGWANGHHRGIEYIEIWNEPDLDPDDSTHKRCWGGTAKQFYEFFDIALTHLKSAFPSLKIGGPALAHADREWIEGLIKNTSIKPDFFSWHIYSAKVEDIRDKIRELKATLTELGWGDVESILNEWNYVRSFEGDDWYYSLVQEKGLKGASFVASTMMMSQYEDVDMLMYYDARPCGMNGMFDTDRVCECLKGYYPFYMYNQLYKAGQFVPAVSTDSDIWAMGAIGEGTQALMLSYFNDDDESKDKSVMLSLSGLKGKSLKFYLLDGTHDCECVREEKITKESLDISLDLKLFDTYLIKVV